jgi:hypothetical protein
MKVNAIDQKFDFEEFREVEENHQSNLFHPLSHSPSTGNIDES